MAGAAASTPEPDRPQAQHSSSTVPRHVTSHSGQVTVARGVRGERPNRALSGRVSIAVILGTRIGRVGGCRTRIGRVGVQR